MGLEINYHQDARIHWGKEEICAESLHGCPNAKLINHFKNVCSGAYAGCSLRGAPHCAITGMEEVDEMILGVI